MESLKVASLFCGCGGTDVGLLGDFDFLGKKYAKNPIEIVYANDIEESACQIFEKNFGIVPDRRDIRTVPASEIPEIDILTGGFPCQSFSIVAQNPKRLGYKDERGMLFFEMCRILREKQPKCFIAENVKGLLSANKGEAFPLIISEFEKSGYRVTHKLINAASFGVPQKRERVIIVGIRNDLGFTYEFPDAVLSESEYNALGAVVEKTVAEKYFFSQKAVDGMKAAKRDMNKGRAGFRIGELGDANACKLLLRGKILRRKAIGGVTVHFCSQYTANQSQCAHGGTHQAYNTNKFHLFILPPVNGVRRYCLPSVTEICKSTKFLFHFWNCMIQ